MAAQIVQWCFLVAAVLIGFSGFSILWLVPLTLTMGVYAWLTDHYWKIRFYDVYSVKDWARFWLETLAGLGGFMVVAFFVGRLGQMAAGRF